MEDDTVLVSTDTFLNASHRDRVERVLHQDGPSLQIPGYSCQERIGSGSFGVVLRGERLADHVPVAIKILSPSHSSSDPTSVKRFHRELEFAIQLRHKNLVSTYEVGSVIDMGGHELAFLAMELCDGGTLDQLCRRHGSLPWQRAFLLVAQALEGLSYMHGATLSLSSVKSGATRATGVVHRDLKPSNLLLHQDTVKIADFGIAKALEASGLTQLTDSRAAVGTLGFMAPEAIHGSRYITACSDVWSMGATLYALLIGSSPRDFRVDEPLVRAFDRPLVPLLSRAAGIPRAVVEVVDRSLAQEPKDRYPSALDFRTAILAAIAHVAAPAGLGSSGGRRG